MLITIFKTAGILERCSLFCPSLSVRLRRVSQTYADWFHDDLLSALLPKTFDELSLYHTNPFSHCYYGDVESMWLMLVHGVDPSIVDHTGESLFQTAVQSGSVPLVHMLLERGCSITSKGSYGYTALHRVGYTNHLALCEFILQHGGNVDALSKNGSTPLLIASREGNKGIVELMLNHGADPNDGGDKSITPLMVAASEGHSEIVDLLLARGANPQETFCGRTALHEAVQCGNLATCEVLLSRGHADPFVCDSEGKTPKDLTTDSRILQLFSRPMVASN